MNTGILDEGHLDHLLLTVTGVSEDPEVRKNVYMQPLNKSLTRVSNVLRSCAPSPPAALKCMPSVNVTSQSIEAVSIDG